MAFLVVVGLVVSQVPPRYLQGRACSKENVVETREQTIVHQMRILAEFVSADDIVLVVDGASASVPHLRTSF